MAVHATILAGGAGTRLWPRSRRGQPKHLLALQKGSAPLLRQTYERIRSLVDEVHVVTERSQVDSICEVLPELTPDHIIIEPVARGTASALGLAAMTLAQRDAGAVMLSIPADHIVGDGRRFGQTIRRVVKLASQSSQLVTVGLTPYYPATGFGYIRTDGQARFGRTTGLKVVEFIEKPAFERASRFVGSGGYYWVPGYCTGAGRAGFGSVAGGAPVPGTGQSGCAAVGTGPGWMALALGDNWRQTRLLPEFPAVPSGQRPAIGAFARFYAYFRRYTKRRRLGP